MNDGVSGTLRSQRFQQLKRGLNMISGAVA